MTINLTLSPKVRNGIAEAVSIAGLLEAAIPQFAATVHLPQWAGAVLALVVTIGNQLIKDSAPIDPARLPDPATPGTTATASISATKPTPPTY